MLDEASRLRMVVHDVMLAGNHRGAPSLMGIRKIGIGRPQRCPQNHRGEEGAVAGDWRDVATHQHSTPLTPQCHNASDNRLRGEPVQTRFVTDCKGLRRPIGEARNTVG